MAWQAPAVTLLLVAVVAHSLAGDKAAVRIRVPRVHLGRVVVAVVITAAIPAVAAAVITAVQVVGPIRMVVLAAAVVAGAARPSSMG